MDKEIEVGEYVKTEKGTIVKKEQFKSIEYAIHEREEKENEW